MRIADIKIGERHRRDLGNIPVLAASIAEIGLLHPVVVTPDGTLIAGARRIAACVSLGWTDIAVTVVDIPAIVRGEYAENTCRKDFAPSEAVAIWQAMESYQVQGKPLPDSVIGLSQRGQPNRRRDRAAEALGTSKNTLTRAKAVMDAQYDDLIERMDTTGNVAGALKEVRKRQRTEAKQAIPPDMPQPSDRYRLIRGDIGDVFHEIADGVGIVQPLT